MKHRTDQEHNGNQYPDQGISFYRSCILYVCRGRHDEKRHEKNKQKEVTRLISGQIHPGTSQLHILMKYSRQCACAAPVQQEGQAGYQQISRRLHPEHQVLASPPSGSGHTPQCDLHFIISCGLAHRMSDHCKKIDIIKRPDCRNVKWLLTSAHGIRDRPLAEVRNIIPCGYFEPDSKIAFISLQYVSECLALDQDQNDHRDIFFPISFPEKPDI